MVNIENQAENDAILVFKRVRKTFQRSRLTAAEAAEKCGMSLNTAKKVLFGEGAHKNSALRLQRGLDDFLQARESVREDKEVLIISGHASADTLALLRRLMDVMRDAAMLPPDSNGRLKKTEIEHAEKLLKACLGMLPATAI